MSFLALLIMVYLQEIYFMSYLQEGKLILVIFFVLGTVFGSQFKSRYG